MKDYIAQDEYNAAYWLSRFEGYRDEDEEDYDSGIREQWLCRNR